MASLPAGINRILRAFMILVTIAGFMGLSSLHVMMMPQESPREAVQRLVGIDIAQTVHAEHQALPDKQCSADVPHGDSHQGSHKSHGSMTCPLCPFLMFGAAVIGTFLPVLYLSFSQLKAFSDHFVIRGPPHGTCLFLPPVRGPPSLYPV